MTTNPTGSERLHTLVECEYCNGSGEVDDRRCLTCKGTGVRTCLG